MFGPKYVFETKSTRVRRLILSGVLLCGLVVLFLTTFIAYIPIYAKMQKQRATDAFFERSPDAIVVFTGDQGRIAYAMEQLKKNPTSKLFISGVYSSNSVKTLLNKQITPSTPDELPPDDIQVDLDYESKNTFENVRETVQFVQSDPMLKKVMIISSDYHIMRIKLIISHFMDNSETEFFFDSVPSSYSSWSGKRKLLKESIKIARTFILLKIFREDVVNED